MLLVKVLVVNKIMLHITYEKLSQQLFDRNNSPNEIEQWKRIPIYWAVWYWYMGDPVSKTKSSLQIEIIKRKEGEIFIKNLTGTIRQYINFLADVSIVLAIFTKKWYSLRKISRNFMNCWLGFWSVVIKTSTSPDVLVRLYLKFYTKWPKSKRMLFERKMLKMKKWRHFEISLFHFSLPCRFYANSEVILRKFWRNSEIW